MIKKQYDAIIIGAGIIGNCIAFELAKKGFNTLNVDKLAESGMGSTAGSCACIRLYYSTPQAVALARESYYYWIDWRKYLGVIDPVGMAHYKNTGGVVIKTEVNQYLKNVKSSLEALGVGYLDLAPEDLKDYLPDPVIKAYHPQKWIDDPAFGQPAGRDIAGAIYIPETGLISDPKLSAHNVQVAAESRGAKFLFHAAVTGILKKNSRAAGVALADGREIAAPVVVNASGPHSFVINRMAGVEEEMNIKTRALKVEVAHVPSPEGVTNWETTGVTFSDSDIACYTRPETGNHWLIGSEDPPCDPRIWVDDPDNWDRNFTEQCRVQIMRMAMRVPGIRIPNQPSGIVDLYDVSDDWYPVYDKSALPGFYMAVGTSGNQYKNAPAVGAFMAGLIAHCESGHDHDAAPFQYSMKYLKGRTLDIGYFSRNRKINKDSSFSVIG